MKPSERKSLNSIIHRLTLITMKTYALFVIGCFFLLSTSSPAKIKNGYVDIQSAHGSLRSLKILLKDDRSLSVFQRLSLRNKMADLIEFISYYELTEKLLDQFKTISPALYHEIDTLKDFMGRPLDVYVKFVHEKEMPGGVAGTTNLNQDKDDRHRCLSEFGHHTISVRIAAVRKSLFLLAHEFGHVKYQVPNLASYLEYYSKIYLENSYKRKSMGHSDKDPSGRHAMDFTRRFRENYLTFVKQKERKIETHLALLQQIKDGLQ